MLIEVIRTTSAITSRPLTSETGITALQTLLIHQVLPTRTLSAHQCRSTVLAGRLTRQTDLLAIFSRRIGPVWTGVDTLVVQQVLGEVCAVDALLGIVLAGDAGGLARDALVLEEKEPHGTGETLVALGLAGLAVG
jgi:hypothetical protein